MVVAAGLALLMFTGLRQATATHTTLADLLDLVAGDGVGSQRVQLGGSTVVPGSIAWDEYRSRPAFTVTDGEHTMRARYVGSAVLPDTFQDRAQVVLEGEYDARNGVFSADVVYAKCPSKYEGQDYEDQRQAVAQG